MAATRSAKRQKSTRGSNCPTTSLRTQKKGVAEQQDTVIVSTTTTVTPAESVPPKTTDSSLETAVVTLPSTATHLVCQKVSHPPVVSVVPTVHHLNDVAVAGENGNNGGGATLHVNPLPVNEEPGVFGLLALGQSGRVEQKHGGNQVHPPTNVTFTGPVPQNLATNCVLEDPPPGFLSTYKRNAEETFIQEPQGGVPFPTTVVGGKLMYGPEAKKPRHLSFHSGDTLDISSQSASSGVTSKELGLLDALADAQGLADKTDLWVSTYLFKYCKIIAKPTRLAYGGDICKRYMEYHDYLIGTELHKAKIWTTVSSIIIKKLNKKRGNAGNLLQNAFKGKHKSAEGMRTWGPF